MKILIAALLLTQNAYAFPILPANISYVESSPAHTYYAASPLFPPATVATDVCTLTGTTSKLIKVYKIRVNTYQTTAGSNFWSVVKRNTLNASGSSIWTNNINPGSSTTWRATPADSAELVAGGSVAYWLANPTTGTTVGTLRAVSVASPAASGTALTGVYEFDFGPVTGGRAVVLRAANESVSLAFNNSSAVVVPSGMSVGCEWVWTEENY